MVDTVNHRFSIWQRVKGLGCYIYWYIRVHFQTDTFLESLSELNNHCTKIG